MALLRHRRADYVAAMLRLTIQSSHDGVTVLDIPASVDVTIGQVKAKLKEATQVSEEKLRLVLPAADECSTVQPSLSDEQVVGALLPPEDDHDDERSLTLSLIYRTDLQVEWLRRVRVTPLSLDAPAAIREDREVVLEALRYSGLALHQAAPRLRGDRAFVLQATEVNVDALAGASEDLLVDRDFLIAAAERQPATLRAMPEEIRADRSFVMSVIQRRGGALGSVAEQMKADRDLVMAAVEQDGLALEHASETLRGDRAVAIAAVTQHGAALAHASDDLRKDKEVVLAALRAKAPSGGAPFQWAARELRDDTQFVLEASRVDPKAACFASARLKKDRDFMRAAQAGEAYSGPALYTSEEGNTNEEVGKDELGDTGSVSSGSGFGSDSDDS